MKCTMIVAVLAVLASSCAQKPLIEISEQKDLPKLSSKSRAVNQSSSVSLASIASRVVKNHPQLRAARLRIDEAQGRVVQAGRSANPDLGVGLGKTVPGSEGSLEVSFSQRFPVTNRLHLEKRVSLTALKLARQEVKIAERELVMAAQLLAVEALSLQQKKVHLGKQINALEELVGFIEEAAERGELSALDAAQTRVELSSLEVQQQRLQREAELKVTELKGYLGMSISRPLRITGSLPKVALPSNSVEPHRRADYRAKIIEIEHARGVILLEKSKAYDDVEASVSGTLAREEDAPDGLETEGVLGVGLSIPLPLHNRNEGNIMTATARTKRLMLEKKALAAEIRNQAGVHRKQMENWLALSKQVRGTLIPQAQAQSEQLEQTYRTGQGEFISFLKSKTQLLELESDLIDHQQSFHQARVRFLAAAGREQGAF